MAAVVRAAYTVTGWRWCRLRLGNRRLNRADIREQLAGSHAVLHHVGHGGQHALGQQLTGHGISRHTHSQVLNVACQRLVRPEPQAWHLMKSSMKILISKAFLLVKKQRRL